MRMWSIAGVVAIVLLSWGATSLGAWDPNTDPALMGWWKLDEISGTTAADSSGRGNNGTLNGNPTWGRGYYGGALQFDGTGDYVDCGTGLNFADSFTITAWIKVGASGLSADRKIAGNEDNANGGYKFGYFTNGKVECEIRTSSNGATLNRDTAGGTVLAADVWYHVAGVYSQGQYIRTYVNGKLDRELVTTAVIGLSKGTFWLGRENYALECYWLGSMDDVRIYKRAMTAAEVKSMVPPVVKATNPSPADGAIGVMMGLFTWTPGETATLEDVYLGDTPELTEANRVSTHQSIMFKMYYHVSPPGFPLVPGKTYYWRIDAVEASGTIRTGNVWSFTMAPTSAYSPSPRNGDKWIDPNADLSWKPGQNATKHTLYLGTDRAKVEARDASVSKGTLPVLTYEPGTLAKETTYYWVVDESGAGNYAGELWNFTTAGGPGGIKGEYFANTTRDFPGAPAMTRIDPSVDFNWGTGGPGTPIGADNFSVRWTADLEIAVGDAYTFIVRSDDGGRLWLNDQRIVNAWVDRGATDSFSEAQNLEPGVYALVMEYYEVGGDASAQLSWQTPSVARQVIPPGPLQPPVRARAIYPQDADVNIPQDATLMWSIGEKAVTHQVYLGTDKAAVEAATPADTAIYRGSQGKDENTFAPGALEFNTTYYWRVDEVNDTAVGSPWKSSVWSFTTADFIIVDDFETYTNDSPNRLFQTWIDGYGFSEDEFFPAGDPGNGTGSAVGHDIWATGTPYTDIVETSVVRPGSTKSMPLAYDNSNSPFNSEAVRTWESPQNWTLNNVNTLSLQVYGYPLITTTAVSETGGKMSLTGDGTDIWNASDEFTFAYKTLNGDGTLIAKVVSNGTGSSTWTKGGVMIRDSLNGNSAHAMTVMTAGGGNGAAFQNRATAGLNQGANDATSNTNSTSVVAPPYWVKIERSGDTFTGSISSDGTIWSVMNTVDVVMTDPVYIGLCVTSGAAGVERTFQFEGIKSTGGVTGQWQGAIIDSPCYNSPQDFYVVLQDSLGKSAVVSNATAVNSGDWLDVQIPLSQFTGVNPAKIKKMTIGVGKRTNPTADGSGELFIDDIRVIKPQQ